MNEIVMLNNCDDGLVCKYMDDDDAFTEENDACECEYEIEK